MNLKDYIRSIPDYPKKGILFRDITTLIKDPEAFNFSVDKIIEISKKIKFDKVAAIESRGFILGAALAQSLNCGFVPIRKKGKLPYKVISETYDLEYGKDTLEIHVDALEANNNVVLIDDVLATGGTINASLKILETFKVNIIECQFLIEIKALKGYEKIVSLNKRHHSLINF